MYIKTFKELSLCGTGKMGKYFSSGSNSTSVKKISVYILSLSVLNYTSI